MRSSNNIESVSWFGKVCIGVASSIKVFHVKYLMYLLETSLTEGKIHAGLTDTATNEQYDTWYVCVTAPIIEELIFRGMIMGSIRAFLKAAFPDKKYENAINTTAAILNSLPFAAIHEIKANKFLAGMVYSNLDQEHGSLIPSIAGHMTHNAISISCPSKLITSWVAANTASDIYRFFSNRESTASSSEKAHESLDNDKESDVDYREDFSFRYGF